VVGIVGKVLAVLNSVFNTAVTEIKAEINFGDNVQAELFQPPGIDSKPLIEDRVYLSRRTESGAYVIIGALDTKNVSVLKNGEIKVYSRSSAGAIKASVLCDSLGFLTLNDGVDYAVRFSQLQIAFDQLKADFNALVSTYNTHTHPYNPGPGSPIPSQTTQSTGLISEANILPAKIDTIKVP